MRKIIVITWLLLMTNCGFKAVYETSNQDNLILRQIEIAHKNDLLHQELRHSLEELLLKQSQKKYILDLDVKSTNADAITSASGNPSRISINVSAKFYLRDIKTNEILKEGSVSSYGEYDVDDNRFANYSSADAIKAELTKILAEKIRNKIITWSISLDPQD